MTPAGVQHAFCRTGLTGDWVAQDQPDSLPTEKGAYALVLDLEHSVALDFPADEHSVLVPGIYIYLGSARGPGGLRARLRRHFSIEKKIHWHVDQLTTKARGMWAVPVVGGNECTLVETLLRSAHFQAAAPGFGSSDCRSCTSHLLSLRKKGAQTKAAP